MLCIGQLPLCNKEEHQSEVQCRELKQKRKRDAASSDQPERTKHKVAGNDSLPGGVGHDSTAVGASTSSWEPSASPQSPEDDSNAEGPFQKFSPVPNLSHSTLIDTCHGEPMSHVRNGVASAAHGSGHDQLMDKMSSFGDLGQHRLESPASAEHAQHDSDAHDLHCLVEHLSGHLPDSADEDAPEAEDERAINEENNVWERKQSSMTDIDVVN